LYGYSNGIRRADLERNVFRNIAMAFRGYRPTTIVLPILEKTTLQL
jgi:hypothetical protein